MADLSPLLAEWPVDQVAVGVTDADRTRGLGGDHRWRIRIASVSKLLSGFAGLVAVEQGHLSLDEPAGPPGATVRHLLAHASGLSFNQDRMLATPGRRRIYSNLGIERFAEHLTARTGVPFAEYLRREVLAPLGMHDSALRGSPARSAESTVADLLRFARELLRPSLISPAMLAEATTAQFPELPGVLPGVGRFNPNPWGLTFELRGEKQPHWTGTRNSPRTFGHFGRSGTFLWIDPQAGLGCVALTERTFGEWALATWPRFSDAVLARF